MSLATTALVLYLRTKAQLHHLTAPATPQADHNHLPHPIAVTFPLHTTRLPKRRRPHRSLTTALRHLLRPKAPPPPIHVAAPPAPSVSAPAPTPPAPNPPCRLCAAAPD